VIVFGEVMDDKSVQYSVLGEPYEFSGIEPGSSKYKLACILADTMISKRL
jgi:hypothetical protein